MNAIAKLKAAFPGADEVSSCARDYGFKHGVSVRVGGRCHAVKVTDGNIDAAIDTLRKWVPKEFQRRDDVEGDADQRANGDADRNGQMRATA